MRLQTYKLFSALLTLLLLTILVPDVVYATHIRAGDLTMRRKPNGGDREYIITAILYRDVTGVNAGDGLIDFGDGSDNAIVKPQSLGYTEDGETEIIQYQVEHTFPSDGNYKVSYFERNRNPGVRNMEISSETPFYIQSEFMINPALGLNSSPVLLIPPVIKGAIGQKFIHNAGAYDIDGDSLSYRLTVCLQGTDTPVQNYRFPDDPNEDWSKVTEQCETPAVFYIDESTGDLTWDAPFVAGEYNVAFFVEEWRDGIRIGAVNRDMQVIIIDPLNLRPIIEGPADTCVIAGDPLLKEIFAYDQDNAPCYNSDSTLDWGPHPIKLEISQQSDEIAIPPYADMIFTPTYSGVNNSEARGDFSWTPQCADIRQEPYKITFEAKDFPDKSNTQLGTLQNWNVRVLGPAPTGLVAEPASSTDLSNGNTFVSLTWDPYTCDGADEIHIYRKKGSFDFNPVCETGLPSWTGYEYVNSVDVSESSFRDFTVDQGANYCYRIYATFRSPQGGESIASEEDCAFIPDSQYIVQVDVESTEEENGQINLKWTVPMDVTPGRTPYYNVYRGEGMEKIEFDQYTKINTNPLTDTTLVDNLLNTVETEYHYRIEFLEGTSSDNAAPRDTTTLASYVRLSSDAGLDFITLNWTGNVPWNLTPDTVIVNTDTSAVYHKVYRKIEGDETSFSLYDSVFTHSNGLSYTDRGTADLPLDDRKLYTYYIETIGSFEHPSIAEPLINRTQELTVELLDTIPPCPPILSLANLEEGFPMDSCVVEPETDGERSCQKDRFEVELTWLNEQGSNCDDDIVSYNIYYSRRTAVSKNDFGAPVATMDHPEGRPLTIQLLYEFLNREYVEGSYAVTAVDDSGNESDLSNIIIQDNCHYYELPNAFSPNGDGINETFIPMRCPRFVKSINFTVFNRWGVAIFSYNSDEHDGDIEINWNGKTDSGNDVEPGNYYYRGEMMIYRLEESDEKQEIKGSFVILKGNESQ
ncbi:gliding motility-associated C-terminal domain-containing protein [Flammeovirga sp. SubArs3]|uniref:T9SS type B sorting domain-containing protein n=1 Tax=Flammeovirga sp. SubArs3 TaxID=2995316 RepID=UPI00248C544E|nr:gliding motility-associated C-terminal domain-containing protein [Flammeovirga sp. SubArs3]